MSSLAPVVPSPAGISYDYWYVYLGKDSSEIFKKSLLFEIMSAIYYVLSFSFIIPILFHTQNYKNPKFDCLNWIFTWDIISVSFSMMYLKAFFFHWLAVLHPQHTHTIPTIPSTPQSPVGPLTTLNLLSSVAAPTSTGSTPEAVYPIQAAYPGNDSVCITRV